jgi:hypothetical protein
LTLLFVLCSGSTENGNDEESYMIYEVKHKYSEFLVSHFEERLHGELKIQPNKFIISKTILLEYFKLS